MRFSVNTLFEIFPSRCAGLGLIQLQTWRIPLSRKAYLILDSGYISKKKITVFTLSNKFSQRGAKETNAMSNEFIL